MARSKWCGSILTITSKIAQQLRVQSVPTVYAFVDGQPVDGFSGAQPESALTQFVEKLSSMGGAGVDIAGMLEAANTAVETQDFAGAMQIYQQVMEADPESADALAGLVRCLTGMQDHQAAREIIDQLNDEFREKPSMQAAIAALEHSPNVRPNRLAILIWHGRLSPLTWKIYRPDRILAMALFATWRQMRVRWHSF